MYWIYVVLAVIAYYALSLESYTLIPSPPVSFVPPSVVTSTAVSGRKGRRAQKAIRKASRKAARATRQASDSDSENSETEDSGDETNRKTVRPTYLIQPMPLSTPLN